MWGMDVGSSSERLEVGGGEEEGLLHDLNRVRDGKGNNVKARI